MADSDERIDAAFQGRLREQAAAVGIGLDPKRLGQLEHYFRLLLKWNRTINLTALALDGCPDRTLKRLFIEPLQAARFVEDAPLSWFDLGSGGGSPAVPMKIMNPLLRLTMVESRSRKAAFLREVVRSLELTDTNVVSARIEELSGLVQPGQVDLVTVRAVKLEAGLLRAAAVLLRLNGRLLLFGSTAATVKNHGVFHVIQEGDLASDESTLRILSRVAERV